MKRLLAIVMWLGFAGVATAQPVGSAGSDDLPPPTHYQEVPRLSEGLTDGKKLPMPEVHLSKPERETDKRPVYVGAGIVVLALIFWMNRRQRERFEREDRRERGDAEHDDEEST